MVKAGCGVGEGGDCGSFLPRAGARCSGAARGGPRRAEGGRGRRRRDGREEKVKKVAWEGSRGGSQRRGVRRERCGTARGKEAEAAGRLGMRGFPDPSLGSALRVQLWMAGSSVVGKRRGGGS